MKILGIASVTGDCGVALIDGEDNLGHIVIPHGRGLSESLLPSVRTLLAEAGVGLSSLDGIAVSAGPGSFTGIKVGLAAAKGLAYALSCKVVGISTLEALAWRIGRRLETIVPVIHAGRDHIFVGSYCVSEGNIKQSRPDRLTSLPHLQAHISTPALLVGDAALKAYDILPDRKGIIVETPAREEGRPLPVAIAQLGLLKMTAGNFTTTATLSPIYLQRHEAEVRLAERSASLPDGSCSA